ncbi:serine/threonine protein kinase [Amycolatopsis sp. CA-128772]|uniref:protein kinase domain-containing protein n=1 Tax=Amycolatopsis sp. CA-128772 TaxID=2073159 RepID=UPI000CD06029|nr:serine/threonine protein kinase [Amycolatopsis sp. CA-128772]
MAHEGTLIGERYRLLGPAGHGRAWRARDERLDRLVALRPLFDEPAAIPAPRTPVCDVVDEDSTTYLVLEYPASRTLTELLEEHGVLPPEQVARLGARLASVLAAAHDDGVLHPAVEPDRVLLAPDGHAELAAGARPPGTEAYLAPEVTDGGFPDFPAEVFSLGATLYAALTGRPPAGSAFAGSGSTGSPVTEAVLRLLHPDPAARPTMAAAEHLLSSVAPRRPGGLPDGGASRIAAGDYRCV